VYLAANDGMLHAFDSTTGAERWAYIPPMVLGDLWKLARDDWSSEHRYFLDGPTSVSDIYDTNAWKTILVGAMGKGGKGIYALDVTTPDAPKALWNFTHANLGYTYGTPIITKISNTWVVLVASGYNNNEAAGDGVGYVFVLNAATGALLKTFTTNVGNAANPSGLAYLNVKINDFQRDNTTISIYGGDLLGNMWRFDPSANDGAAGNRVVALTAAKPITVAPEIGEVEGQTVLFFGTGQYLGPSDLSPPNGGWTTQSFYAIKDDGTTEVDETTALVQQTADNTDSRIITASTYTGSYWSGTKFGWFINLPGDGERVNLPAQLYFGTVLFASTLPTANECQPGGYSYLYALDYATGLRVSGATENAWKYVSPLVGVTVAKLPSGTVKIYGITADGNRLTTEPPSLPINIGGAGSDSGIRVMWRELLN